MYKIIIILLLAVSFIACENNTAAKKIPADLIQNPNTAEGVDKDMEMPVVVFEEKEHDFGKMIKGEKASYSFSFTNTGNADLILSKVKATCGCTASEYPVDPVKPGETKKIKVVFDSSTKKGFQNKRITVFTNASPSLYTLRIKADVLMPGQE